MPCLWMSRGVEVEKALKQQKTDERNDDNKKYEKEFL